MQKDGLIQRPSPRRLHPQTNILIRVETAPQESIHLPVHELPRLQLRQVGDRADLRLWNEYIHRYHYLGHKAQPGAQLRYWVSAADHLVTLLGFGAAAWLCTPSNKLIGWTHELRQKYLHLVVNNARFLILPWVCSDNLTSKVLGLAAKQLAGDWLLRYGYRPLLLKTFVEINRFNGTCYRAANWNQVGKTQGRAKLGSAGKQSVPIKSIWLYLLQHNFKCRLTG
ncbi:MAG: Druantia anti-phage system protein DruA [Candidatus Methylumidiphilus sp.]